ncbi:hypothetical protein SALBM217S_09653 [Streptomyces griseoloalbus]
MTRRHDRKGAPAWSGRPYPLGASYDGEGTNFALFSEVAERADLVLADDDGRQPHRAADRGRPQPGTAVPPVPRRAVTGRPRGGVSARGAR